MPTREGSTIGELIDRAEQAEALVATMEPICRAAARYLATGNGSVAWSELYRALKGTSWLEEAEDRLRRA